MKKSFYLLGLACMLLLAACSDDEVPITPEGGETVDLTATFESVGELDARRWPEGSRVSVNAREYALETGTSAEEAVIRGVWKADRYNAFWPAAADLVFADDVVQFTLPQEQPYVGDDNPGPFAAGCEEDGRLVFRQLCGTLTFHFYGAGTITAVGLRADGGEAISGPASIRLVPGRAVELEMSADGENTLFLMADQGVELAARPTIFRFYMPAGAYESGFTMIAVDDSGNQMDLKVPGPIDLDRGADVDFEATKFDPNQVVKDWMTLRLESTSGPADRPDAKWRENDGVWINGENFPISNGAGTKEAEVEKVRQARRFWASYPAAEQVTYTEGRFNLTLPRTQTYAAASPYCGPMVAYGTKSPLELRYLCGFLRLALKGEGTVYQLKLTGTGLVGKATAEGGDSGIGDLRMEAAEPGDLTITLPDGGIALSESAAAVYCVVPPGTYSDLKLTATDVDGRTIEVAVPGPLTVARATVCEAPATELRFSGGGGDATDLSARGAANCYVVTGPGQYSFATRKVNGSEVTGIAEADWVWATRFEGSDGNELISDITYADGRIGFTATTRKGNVVIAAEDRTGQILWSWHIWLTDDPGVDEMLYKCGKTFLDRNLGAVSATPGKDGTAGVLYQWGRKDPFAGGKGEEDLYSGGDNQWTLAREVTVMNTGFEWKTSYLGSDRSVAYATAHPTELLADNQAGTWTNVADNTLWGASKTDADPCPPGYRVPEMDFGEEFSPGWMVEPGVSELFLSGFTNGLVYLNEGRSHFWPLAGQRWGDSDRGCYTNLNSVGCYWTITFAENGCPLNFNFTDGGVIWRTGDSRWNTCQALSVRCCKE